MSFSFLISLAFKQTADPLNAKPDPGSLITPQQYGAKGDGIADDTAALRAADAAAGGSVVTCPLGTYLISSNVTFNAPVIMMPGSTIAYGGNSLAFNGLFDAGDFEVFRGTGLVSWGPGQAIVKGAWFGMSADNTDVGNSAAFTSMMNSLGGYVDIRGGATYRTVVTPAGNIPITTIVFNAPSHTTWINNSFFKSSPTSNPSSTAILIGGDTKYGRTNYRIYGLRVTGVPDSTWAAAWAPGRVGVDVRNVNESEIHISQTNFFNTGLQMTGDGGSVGYNKIYLDGELVQNLYGINFVLTPANNKSGWVNENNFYGGRFSLHDEGRNPAGLGITPVGINIPYPDTTYHMPNNNRFWGPSIEGTITTVGGTTYTTLAFSISGCTNVVYQPRTEGTMGGVFTGNSTFNAAALLPGINYVDSVVGNRLSWTNGNYDRFTSVGSLIASAIQSTGPKSEKATSNSISTSVGSIYQMFVTLNLTSGQAPTLTGSDSHFPATTLSNGLNRITWTASTSANTLTLTNTANANFSIRSAGPGPAGVYDTTGTNQVTSLLGTKLAAPYMDNKYADILAVENTFGGGGTRTLGLYDTSGAGVIGFGNGTLALRDKIIFGNSGAGGTPPNSAPTSSTEANVGIYYGNGSPNSAVTALVGSIYLRSDGGPATSIYVKESGSGNTGWVAYASAPITGSGAPSANAAFPGQIYIDSKNHNAYIAVNTGTGAGDWHKL